MRNGTRMCAAALALLLGITGAGGKIAFAEERANLALGRPAVASSEAAGLHAEVYAIDGDLTTAWMTNENPSTPVWLRLDFYQPTTFNQAVLSAANNCITSYKIQVSQDGSAWEDIFQGGALTGTKTINFETQTARYVRFYVLEMGPDQAVGIQEFEIYHDPSPGLAVTPDEEPGIYETPQTAEGYAKQAREIMAESLVMRTGNPNLMQFGTWGKLDENDPEIMPVQLSNSVAVPLRRVTELLGGEIGYREGDDTVWVEYQGRDYYLRVGGAVVESNGGSFVLPDPVAEKDHRTLVPLPAIETMFQKKIFSGQYDMIVISNQEYHLDDKTPRNKQLRTYLKQEFCEGLYSVLEIQYDRPEIAQAAGEPALLSIGDSLPELRVGAAYTGMVSGTVYAPDGTVADVVAETQIARDTALNLPFNGSAVQQGTYRYEIVFSSGYQEYRYNRYVTAAGKDSFPSGKSPLAYINEAGKLCYTPDYLGNQVMDFSTAGYGGGGVSLPEASVTERVSPSGGDDSAAIQKAIDRVSALPADKQGMRGVVELQKGVFRCDQPIKISASGVVLRGSGAGAGETVLRLMNTANLSVSGTGNYAAGDGSKITDRYVPSGSGTVNVENPELFREGDQVLITRQVTGQWLRQLKMDQLYRNGSHQTWLEEGSTVSADRTITKIDGNTLCFDAALPDRLDADYDGATPVVEKYSFPGRISNAGVEDLRIIVVDKPEQPALDVSAVMDAWLKNIVIEDGTNSLNVRQSCRRVTCENIEILHSEKSLERAAPSDFTVTGTQTLLLNCRSSIGAGMWSFTTGSRGAGPIAIVDSFGGLSPHQRWTTGMLLDNSVYPDPRENTQGVAFRNRNTMGSGHGWTTGWSVAWNVETPYFLVSAAPGTMNWSVGGIGEKTSVDGDPDGLYSSHGVKVQPESLYKKQLEDRQSERSNG